MDIDNYWKAIDLALKLDDKTSFYWNFYVAANIAVIGWMLNNGAKLSWKPRLIGIVGYGLFLFMSYVALFGAYSQYDVVVADIRKAATNLKSPWDSWEIVKSGKEMPFSNKGFKLYCIHLIGDILMIGIILCYGSPWRKRTVKIGASAPASGSSPPLIAEQDADDQLPARAESEAE